MLTSKCIKSIELGMKNLFTRSSLSLQNPGNLRNDALQLVFDNISGVVILVDKELKVVIANSETKKKVKQALGIDLEEGQYLPSIYPLENQSLLESLYSKVLEGQVQKREFLLRVNGQMRFFENTYTPVYNKIGEVEGILIQAKEFTDANNSHERYRFLFYKHPIAMWKYDPLTLKVIEANDAALALYGYTREEFLELNIKDMRPAEDIPLLLSELENVFKGNPNKIS